MPNFRAGHPGPALARIDVGLLADAPTRPSSVRADVNDDQCCYVLKLVMAHVASSVNTAVPPKELLHILIIGFAFATTFYGITIMQAYVYCRRYPDDSIRLKICVLLLFVLDTLTTVFAAHALYTYVVNDYLQPVKLGVVTWSLIMEDYLTVVIATIVQFYFTRSLWIFSRRNRPLAAILVFLTLLGLGSGTWIAADLFMEPSVVTLYAVVKPRIVVAVCSGSTAVADVIISAGLCIFLQMSRTGIQRLYGITIMQAYVYYRRYLQDGAALKFFVAFLIVLDTLTTVFAAHGLHTYVVDDYLQPAKVNTIVWSLITENYLCILTAVVVQFYFAQRLWILSHRSIALTGTIAVLALVSLGTGTWVGAEIEGWSLRENPVSKGAVYCLTKSPGDRIGQLFDFVTILAAPMSFLYLPVILMQSKLYTNLLLATLNVRSYLHSQAIGGGSAIEVETGSLVFTRGTNTGSGRDSNLVCSCALTSRNSIVPPITFDAKRPDLTEESSGKPTVIV
ncbi:hypothetical protein ACG7TL_002149 [Trametes sanguinea]